MILTGYGDFDWIPHGYSYNLPGGWLPFPGVEPQTLPRPGTFATFTVPRIDALTIPGWFSIEPENTMGDDDTHFEVAWKYLFKRLNPYSLVPRQLRGELNDGTPIAVPAMLRVHPQASEEWVNVHDAHFVVVQPFWVAQAATTSSGVTFS